MAGGSALIASNLIRRTTDDLDLFAGAPLTSVREARDALVEALATEGHRVDVIRDAETFCRMVVHSDTDAVLMDLAIDSPPIRVPSVTILGLTLAPVSTKRSSAQMLRTILRFSDDEIALSPGEVPHARKYFDTWASGLAE